MIIHHICTVVLLGSLYLSIRPHPLCDKTKTKKKKKKEKKTRGVSTNKPGRLALIPAVCLGLYVPSGNSRSGYLDR